jgi:hypothetical protein
VTVPDIESTDLPVRDLRDRDKWWAHDRIIDQYAAMIGIYALGVYVYLCRRADRASLAWPSKRTIAKDLGIGLSSVHKAIETLTDYRLILERPRYTSEGDRTSNAYFLLEPPLEPGRLSEGVSYSLLDVDHLERVNPSGSRGTPPLVSDMDEGDTPQTPPPPSDELPVSWDLWPVAQSALKGRMDRGTYSAHIFYTRARMEGDTLYLRPINPYSGEWLRQRLLPLVVEAVTAVASRPLTVIVEV